jgi:hypothetical protein
VQTDNVVVQDKHSQTSACDRSREFVLRCSGGTGLCEVCFSPAAVHGDCRLSRDDVLRQMDDVTSNWKDHRCRKCGSDVSSHAPSDTPFSQYFFETCTGEAATALLKVPLPALKGFFQHFSPVFAYMTAYKGIPDATEDVKLESEPDDAPLLKVKLKRRADGGFRVLGNSASDTPPGLAHEIPASATVDTSADVAVGSADADDCIEDDPQEVQTFERIRHSGTSDQDVQAAVVTEADLPPLQPHVFQRRLSNFMIFLMTVSIYATGVNQSVAGAQFGVTKAIVNRNFVMMTAALYSVFTILMATTKPSASSASRCQPNEFVRILKSYRTYVTIDCTAVRMRAPMNPQANVAMFRCACACVRIVGKIVRHWLRVFACLCVQ